MILCRIGEEVIYIKKKISFNILIKDRVVLKYYEGRVTEGGIFSRMKIRMLLNDDVKYTLLKIHIFSLMH